MTEGEGTHKHHPRESYMKGRRRYKVEFLVKGEGRKLHEREEKI